tara:strand:- start:215 stop:469 length:255 start_codon:yes stop_codon:yes gene_type:complete
MKTFKQFLEEASNAVQTFRDKGFRIRNLFGPGGKYKKLEPIPKPNTQAKLSKDDKINGQYKNITNPKKPSEDDLIRGTIPIKKA